MVNITHQNGKQHTQEAHVRYDCELSNILRNVRFKKSPSDWINEEIRS